MSIKDLFGRTYVPEKNSKDLGSPVESSTNIKAVKEKQDSFLPQVDYENPFSFAKYGSANLYYKSAIERIIDYYPYDGSDAEITSFYNKSLDIEKYIFDKKYPRTNGYIVLSPTSVATSTKRNGYGVPTTAEYITFNGGPNTVSETSRLSKLLPDPKDSKFQYNNVYDDNLYVNSGLPSNYGFGTRTSNLRSNFDTGVTIEFWAVTGSDITPTQTDRQVVFDMWNNNASSSADLSYGRIRIETKVDPGGSTSPFLLTVQSGTVSASVEQINTASIGASTLSSSLSEWNHYAFVLQNSGSDFHAKLYVNGELNDTNIYSSLNIGELNSKGMQGRLGALITAPTSLSDATLLSQYVGAGKLSGSLDEFRFWKVARNAEQIGRNWFDQVRGGNNSDIANTDLGMYYKFNEGITGTSSVDSVVLDYAGRVCNGTWTGYSAVSRNTGSAILSASAAIYEYEDPIIYDNHPSVITLKSELQEKGRYHDTQNNAQFVNLIPAWVVEEAEEKDSANGSSDLEKMSHIVGAYFDKLYLQISAIPGLRHEQYTSSSYKPVPFAQHLPQSLGLLTPDLFVDSDVLERFKDRNNSELFESDLHDTKNLIYLNLYNSLSAIFKSKGTHRSIRNVLRCFNIDDNLIYFKTYADKETYELNTNLKQTLKKKKRLNFNTASALHAVMHQAQDPSLADSQGYISGSGEPKLPGAFPDGVAGDQDSYGLTVEASMKFPRFFKTVGSVDRNFISASLFGMQTVFTGSGAGYAGGTTSLTGAQDVANFQVYAVRDAPESKNVRFVLTSSFNPHPFNELTSSTYLSVYDENNWNLSVGLRPTKFQSGFISGSEDYAYEVVFRGFNNTLGTVRNSFTVSASVSADAGKNIIRSWKRLYAGAQNTNITGSNLNPSDVEFNSLKYWTQYVDNISLKQHTVDRENAGISGSYQNISPFDSKAATHDIYNLNSLALNWYFGTVTGSDSAGNFYSTDISSGSAFVRDNFGWIGEIGGYPHPGKGHGFANSVDYVVKNELTNEYKFVDPEIVTSDDMVNILSDDDELFGLFDEVPKYVHTVEKSLFAALSEEILDYFAGAVDFNNIIGDPVHRYRPEYKPLETLRQIYFEKFSDVKTVEAFTEYYKWFDDALTNIIEQLVPASANFIADSLNMVESHVLERPKYQTQFPTLEFEQPEPGTSLHGVAAKMLSYMTDLYGGVEASPRPTNLHKNYWKKRAQPGARGAGSFEITSGDAALDRQRRQVRNIMWSRPAFSGSRVTLTTIDGTIYERNRLLSTQFNGVVNLETPTLKRTIKGGVNFPPNKSFAYAYASTYPAGPINTHGSVFIPLNVLYGRTKDFTAIEDLEQWNEEGNVGKKRHRVIGVVQGRDYDGDFTNYTNTKNTHAFPFNIMSGTIRGGADEWISSSLSSSVTITNLHNDVYGDELEKPMQGPFTEYAVGGHQSRHVPLNTSASNNGLFYSGFDNYRSRPEAWKLLLGLRGTCPDGTRLPGAIGLVSADYPWPEANATDKPAYPMTASQKAVYYRDFIAKRPVNIKNIRMRTGSTILGNFEHNYEVVHSFDTYANPRQFIENQPALPTQIFQNTATSSTQTRTIFDLHRAQESHFNFVGEYNVGYLTGTTNNTVIATRFGTVGGPLTDGTGYRDFRSNTFSVYNTLGKRYLTVIKPSQGPSGSISEPAGEGTPGIRVFDIHGQDFGLRSHYARHTARFGRDSLQVTNPGASYDQLPGFHKTHRNNICETRAISCDLIPVISGDSLNNDRSLYFLDNSTSGPVLASADSGSIDFLSASFRGSGNENGATISIWACPSPQTTNMTLWSIGKSKVGSDPLIRIEKESNTNFVVRCRYRSTTDGHGASSTRRLVEVSASGVSALNDNQWHHFAVVLSGTNGSLSSTQDANTLITMYVDGVQQTLAGAAGNKLIITPSGTIQSYDAAVDPPYDFKGFNASAGGIPKKSGSQIYVFGGKSSDTAIGQTNFTGAMDQLSMWTRALDSSEISQIYNGGVPCDLTASAPYLANTNKLHAWYPLGDPSPAGISDDDAIRYGANNGEPLSGTNIIFDHSGTPLNNMYPVQKQGDTFSTSDFTFSSGSGDSAGAPMSTVFPDPLQGCVAAFVGFREDCTFEKRPLFDNFNIQHQIPRDSRQYAWITASLQSTASWWSCGFTPPDFLIRSGSSYIEPLNFASASDFGSYYHDGSINKRRFGWTQKSVGEGANVREFIPVDFVGLNTIIVENINTSSNTLGVYNSGSRGGISGSLLGYFNSDITPGLLANLESTGSLFTSIILNRGGPYGGANWVRMRQGDHPILTNEKRNNKLSTMYIGNVQRNFDLPPLSKKGRPVYINMDYANAFSTSLGGYKEQPGNVTLKTSYNNEMIGFNEQDLNTFVDLNFDSEVTPFEQLVSLRYRPNIDVNWILYSENLFPSTRREFVSSSMTRVGYDNEFWRDTIENRITGAIGLPNSINVSSALNWNGVRELLTQSFWPLDAPVDFATRTAPPVVDSDKVALTIDFYQASSLIVSNSAGELQNTYSSYHFFKAGADPRTDFEREQIPVVVKNAALYSRKHMLASPLSSFNPVGNSSSAGNKLIPGMEANNLTLRLTGGAVAAGYSSIAELSASVTASLHTGSGEAAWQANTLAGYITASTRTDNKRIIKVTGFKSDPSNPWYNDYDAFRSDIKTMAKGFAVVPEFRISEQIEKYAQVGIAGESFDFLSIPGTEFSSSQDSFYKDYSNSDFMKNFADIRKMSDLKASEIRLTCNATIKFNPYKGFYPAQRSLDLVTQFSKSYASNVSVTTISGSGGKLATAVPYWASGSFAFRFSYARPVMQPLFAPGILFNSIKSGMAVDFPVISNGYRIFQQKVTGSTPSGSNFGANQTPTNYMIAAANVTGSDGTLTPAQYISGAFWDARIPFEAIINPLQHMRGIPLVDMEPHPNVKLPIPLTASLGGRAGAPIYDRMASNFFAEVGKFFLNDGEYTKLRSDGVSFANKTFTEGEVYGARMRLRTSYQGQRTYEYESGSDGTNYFYAADGAQAYYKNYTTGSAVGSRPSDITGISGSYELPQDPEKNPNFQHDFTMYSRPSAFGPAVSGRQPAYYTVGTAIDVYGAQSEFNMSASSFGVKDSLNGYNWAFTPPYYYGEAWVDFIFRPSGGVSYDLSKVLQETQILQRRYDPGSPMEDHKLAGSAFYRRTLHRDQPTLYTHRTGTMPSALPGAKLAQVAFGVNLTPYASENINDNAMQMASSVNLFGVEFVPKSKTDKFDRKVSQDNESTGQQWVIQPKFETPMMNFSDVGTRPLNDDNVTVPQNFGINTVPRGMWHQFGLLPDSPDKGVFMEISDIPSQWLRHHYDVVTGSSIYNDYTPADGPGLYKRMKDFSALCGFNTSNSSARLGEVALKREIKEAVVAIPYIEEGLSAGETQPVAQQGQTRKKFINIPTKRFNASLRELELSVEGDSLQAAGASIRRLIEQMKNYVLPPQFDFLNNRNVAPIVMYMFEFKYELDRDDLSYIWQNLAPKRFESGTIEKDVVAHQLMDTELLTEYNLLSNPNLRWMVFKVKQRGQAMYQDMIVSQVDQPTSQKDFDSTKSSNKYPLQFNWPYDFVSIVETINFDVDVKYDRTQTKALKSDAVKDIGKQNKALSKELRATIPLELEKKQKPFKPSDMNQKVKAQNKATQGPRKELKTSVTTKKTYEG